MRSEVSEGVLVSKDVREGARGGGTRGLMLFLYQAAGAVMQR